MIAAAPKAVTAETDLIHTAPEGSMRKSDPKAAMRAINEMPTKVLDLSGAADTKSHKKAMQPRTKNIHRSVRKKKVKDSMATANQ